MKDSEKRYSEEIREICDIADLFLRSEQPWRYEYLKSLVHKADEALSAENEKAADLIVRKCRKIIDEWEVEIPQDNEEDQVPDTHLEEKIINTTLTAYLETEKEHYSNISKAGKDFSDHFKPDRQEDEQEPWSRYRRWSEMETSAWDKLCSEYLARIGFSQNLDFSEHLSDSWGPYNTKFNVITALERIRRIDSEWLESYLMLYDSLK